jgi:NAD(P)-dependent dehydrogenase (short-subunit alcohol dehydrogenase family)
VAAARRSDRLAEVQSEASEGKVRPLAADMRTPASCRRMVAEAIDLLGGLDVLVNNALAGFCYYADDEPPVPPLQQYSD